MKKRIVALLSMALCLCLGAAIFTACGKKETPPTEYTVTYVGGEGATGTAPESEKHEEGEKFTLAANTFTKADNTFAKWSDGTAEYAAGAEYTMPAKDVTFTAVWTATTPGPEGGETPSTTYAVTFVLGEGVTGTAPTVEAKAAGATFALPATTATKTGYTFKAWTDGTTEYAAGAQFTMPASAVTFTAVWVPASIAGKWTAEFTATSYGRQVTGSYEITIIEAAATADYDLESVLHQKVRYAGETTDFTDNYEYMTWTEDATHPGVYKSEGSGLTLTFADHALSGVEEGEGVTRIALDFTYEVLGTPSFSDGHYWTAFHMGDTYLYEITVTGNTFALDMWTANGYSSDPTHDTEEAPYAGSLRAIGEYVYATYTIPSPWPGTPADTEEYLIAADGEEYVLAEYGFALHKGATVKHTVTLEGTEETTTLEVWGGLSIGDMYENFLTANKLSTASADQETDWSLSDGTLVDNSYVPTADVTLTGSNVAKRPNVTFGIKDSYGDDITLPDARIKHLMTYSEPDSKWSIELPEPSEFGFEAPNAGYVFKGWAYKTETKAIGDAVELEVGSNIFQAVWEFPLEGQWTLESETVIVLPLEDLDDPNAYTHPEAVARILLWDNTADAETLSFGWIEFDGTAYTVHGIDGIEEISVAEGELVLEGTHYAVGELGSTASLDGGLYTAEGKPGIYYRDYAFYFYEDDTLSDRLYDLEFGEFYLFTDLITGEVTHAVYLIEGDPDEDTLGVFDLSDGSFTEYALPAKVTITYDVNGGTGTGENYEKQISAGTAIPGTPYDIDDPTPPEGKKFLYWAIRTGTEGNYTYTEISDDYDKKVYAFEDTTVYAVYGYELTYSMTGNLEDDEDVWSDPPQFDYSLMEEYGAPIPTDGQSFTITIPDLTDSGGKYAFLGWAWAKTERDPENMFHNGDTLTDFASHSVNGDITLYAIWQKLAQPTFTFEKGEATEGTDPTVTIPTAANAQWLFPVQLPENTYTAPAGKWFRGWQIGEIIYQAGEYYDAQSGEAVTATAVWGTWLEGVDYTLPNDWAGQTTVRLYDGEALHLVVKVTAADLAAEESWVGIINDGRITVGGTDYFPHFRVDGYVWTTGANASDSNVVGGPLSGKATTLQFDGATYLALYAEGATVTHDITVTFAGRKLVYTYQVFAADATIPTTKVVWELQTSKETFLDMSFRLDAANKLTASEAKLSTTKELSANQTATEEHPLDLSSGVYDPYMWRANIAQGETLTLSGKLTTIDAPAGWNGPTMGLGDPLTAVMRTDAWVNDADDGEPKFDGVLTKGDWTYTSVLTGTYGRMTDADVTITVDFTAPTEKIVVTLQIGEYKNEFTITTSGSFESSYVFYLGADTVQQFLITGIERT